MVWLLTACSDGGSSDPSAATGGATGGNAAPDGGAGADGTGSTTGPPCVSPSQVVYIGDSYLNWQTHTFQADFEALAGAHFRMYAEGGASLASGGIRGDHYIPDQFEDAVAEDPDILVVIMDGGGDDLLIPDSSVPGAEDCKNEANADELAVCQDIVQQGIDRAIAGMSRMVEVGVEDVLYFFYPHLPEGQSADSLAGTNPNVMLDYALPKVEETCDSASMRTDGQLTCHFVDLVPVFDGHPEYFASDGVHPNSDGSAAIAQAIWTKMTDDCIGQPATNGCCSR